MSTAQAAQGGAAQRVLIAQSAMSYPATSRENFYVAVTRGRKSVTIYTDDKQELAAAVARSQPRRFASDLMAGRRAAPKGRLQRGFDAICRRMAAIRLARESQQQERELTHAR